MKRRIYRYMLIFPIAFVLGCSDFMDVNDTPNNPISVPPSVLLPSGLAGSAFANGNELNRFTAVLVNYLAGAAGSPADYDIYNTDGADFGNQWRFEIYGGALVSYKKMIEAADDLGAKAYSGIGKIMMAYTYSIATDVWGDVPYSEALQGDDKGITQPRVDSQEDIYLGNSTLGIQSLFDLVREGLADLDAATTAKPGIDDIVYGGNIDNWKKAGNTLLLKFALTISDREPALATQVINEVLAADSFIKANTENLAVKFGASVGSWSPIYNYIYESSFRDEMIVSTRFVDRLAALGDPRDTLIVTRPTGKFVTVDNGFRGTLPVSRPSWSRWSTAITGENGVGPVKLLTNAQRAFILAEAATVLPGVVAPKTANEYYQEGIRASMAEVGVAANVIDDYIDNNATITSLNGTTEEQVAQIIEQKYIALTGNGLEAWNDWRRTGYPDLPKHQNAVGIDGTRPVRAQYIDQEVARNPNFNVRQPNERVWWDVD